MTATVVLVALAVGTYALKAAGPLLLGGRRLPPVLTRLADLAPAALLAALVVTSTFGTDPRALAVDARAAGLAAAAVALLLRASFVVVVVVAAAATALVRLAL